MLTRPSHHRRRNERHPSTISWRKLLLLAIACAAPGCGDDDKPPKPAVDSYPAPSSPAGTLARLQASYKDKNLDVYGALFESDFSFEFSPDDMIQDPKLPEQWSRSAELDAASRMFRDATVERIVLHFNQSAAVPAEEADQAPVGTWKVLLDNVHLEVHTRNELGEPLELLVDGDRAEFYMRETDSQPPGGDRIWRVVLWRDKPIGVGRPSIETVSWGGIKALYR